MIVACGQMVAHTLGEAASAWPVVERLAARAKAARADLLVLPECTYPAYWLESRNRYDELRRAGGPHSPNSERLLDTQEVTARFGAIARAGGFWLVVGMVEESDGRLYNSAAVIDRAGRSIGIARKSFLWDCDNRWFSPGEQLSVFDTEFGRMGVMICADGRAPEIAATLAANGAGFIVMPTAWVNAIKGTGRFDNPQADFLIRARAREFAVPFACADKSGSEADAMEYVGQSQLVDANGDLIAVAPIVGEHLIVGELTPRRATPARVSEHAREILSRPAKSIHFDIRKYEIALDPSMSAVAIESAARKAGGRAIRLAGTDLSSFVPARCAALERAQALIVECDTKEELCLTDDVFPRARAMENRVFVLMADANGLGIVVAPTGKVLWRRGDDAGVLSAGINVALADDKFVTRETNIWDQRRVAYYSL